MFEVIHRGEVTTTMDAVRGADVHLGVFDSLVAESQTAGRGQYRRNWGSPKGNLYASLRLPMEPPFTGTEAAVACGAAVCAALRDCGYPAYLKWPNDVALLIDSEPRKVCGILLEERGGVLIAGVGLNVASHPGPEAMRESTALMACSLSECPLQGRAVPGPDELWGLLVKSIFSVYNPKTSRSGSWLALANGQLLWRGRTVRLEDGDLTATGVLEGVGAQGQLILREAGGVREYLSGSIRSEGERFLAPSRRSAAAFQARNGRGDVHEGRVHAKQDV